jgi:Domain of unknown function (DUF4252)
MRIACIVLAAAVIPLWAQGTKLQGTLDKLAEKADESVVLTLDKSMLRLTSRFIDEAEQAEVKKVMAGLDSIYVRSLEFAREGEYSAADVEAVRGQLQKPGWSRIVGVRSQRSGRDADVYFKDTGNGQLGGIVVIATEPKELTIVEINGTLDPAHLVDLGGEFGIPRLTAHWIKRDQQ